MIAPPRVNDFSRWCDRLQEGHTAHATQQEAVAEAVAMIGEYKRLCEKVLAIPVISGAKSKSERFAGAIATHTVEAMMQNGGWDCVKGARLAH